MSRMSVRLVAVVIIFACLQPVQARQPLQLSVASSKEPLQLTTDANSVWIRAGESPILQYRYDNVPFKPYVKELYTPGGVNFLLDAPSDHLHHHALMFAVAADGVNFWEETPTAGRQQHTGFGSAWADAPDEGAYAGFRETVHWVASKDRPYALQENRTITVRRLRPGNATVLAWRSDFGLPQGVRRVTLSGSHYFGLGLRFVRSMDGGTFFNADRKDGTVFRGEERLVPSNWCAYTAAVDDKPVTVAMFGHPSNPRHPTTWFTMAKPFAYLSATLNLHEEPLIVSADKPLSLQFAVIAWDGKVGEQEISSAYSWFVDYGRSSTSGEGVDSNDKNK